MNSELDNPRPSHTPLFSISRVLAYHLGIFFCILWLFGDSFLFLPCLQPSCAFYGTVIKVLLVIVIVKVQSLGSSFCYTAFCCVTPVKSIQLHCYNGIVSNHKCEGDQKNINSQEKGNEECTDYLNNLQHPMETTK